jgi:VIT1/CCC1 family predicted Fe2+/Mn2+ transporter
MYSLLVGFFLPPLLAIVQQSKWPDQVRAAVAFLACAIAGAGVAYFQGDLTGKRFVTAGLIVLTTALATYRSFWKSTGVAPAIESRTNV